MEHEHNDEITVIAESELALGFKLIGIKNVFMGGGPAAIHEVKVALDGGKPGLVLVSETLRKSMDAQTLSRIEASLKPLVMFIPVSGSYREQESVELLAKRILGVSIKSLGEGK